MSVDTGPTTALDFARWYGTTVDGLTRRVSAAVGDPLLGREATAEAFARAYERWAKVAVMESPEGWVFRVAVNICRRNWRQRELESRALARMVPEMIGGGPDGSGWAADPDGLYRAVRRLPHRQRVAVRLRYWDDLTEHQIAERMGVPPGTASSLLSAARNRLRTHLRRGGGR